MVNTTNELVFPSDYYKDIFTSLPLYLYKNITFFSFGH